MRNRPVIGPAPRSPVAQLAGLLALVWLAAALAAVACDTVDLGTPPADLNACRPNERFFYERVWPEYLAKDFAGKRCSDAACHGISSPRELLLPAPTSAPTLPLPADWEMIYRSASEQMHCTSVATSPLLAKPTNPGHGGGMLIAPDGPEAALLRAWVEAK